MSLVSYALVAGFAALATGLTVPVVRIISFRVGAVAEPGDRHIHTEVTPRLGGVAMFVGLGAGLIGAAALGDFGAVFNSPSDIVGVFVAALIIFGTGLIDDVRDISAPAKIAGMVLAGSVMTLSGLTIVNVPLPFLGFTVLSQDLATLVTVLWVVLMANAVNLIDGLDGLAAGLVMIAAASFCIYSIKLDRAGALFTGNMGPLLAAIVVGMCVGFLPWNFHPASIFMGDSGALLLGLLMAASTTAVGGQSDNSYTGQSWFFFAPIVIPLLILGVPLIDIVFAVLRRATRGKVFAADKDHIHHRLLRLGHSQRGSVLILWTFTALLSGFALYPALTGSGSAILPISMAAVALLGITLLLPRIRRGDENGDGTRDADGPDGGSLEGSHGDGEVSAVVPAHIIDVTDASTAKPPSPHRGANE